MEFFRSKWIALVALIGFLPSCAVKSHQFADAINKGDLGLAKTYFEPGYAKMEFSLASAPGKYSLPIQYAIVGKNKPLAKFLIEKGSPTTLERKNLTYYCAYNGKADMANYFASIGQGSYSDISKARRDLVQRKKQNRIDNNRTALIGLAVIAAMMRAGSGPSQPSGHDHAAIMQVANAQAGYLDR